MRSFSQFGVALGCATVAALSVASTAHAVPSASFRPRVSRAIGGIAIWTAAGDYNGDGRLDLSVGTESTINRITTFYTQPDGTFPLTGSTTATSSAPTRLSAGDFNRDGRADVLYLDDNTGMKLRLAQPGNTFGPATTLPIPRIADFWGKTSVGDINHDGRLDAMIAYGRSTTNSGGFAIGTQQLDGSFQVDIVTTNSNGYGIANADLNRDGFGDVIIGDELGGNPVRVAYGSAGGTFTVKSFAYGDRGYGVVARDFNGDSIPDIAATAWNQNALGVMLTQPNGDLGAPTFFAGASTADDIAAGDFNGDGIADLVTVSQSSTDVAVNLGNGDGTFVAAFHLNAAARGTSTVTVGDFDGNGGDDIAVAGASGTNVDIFYNSTPEPGSVALLLIGGLTQLVRPRRRRRSQRMAR